MKTRNTIVAAVVLAAFQTSFSIADDLAVIAGQNTRVVASFDEATEEIETIEIETPTPRAAG